nr:fatty acid CoA ligase family protein [Moritella sp.]
MHRFKACAALTPDKKALRFSRSNRQRHPVIFDSLTYHQLEQISDAYALGLLSMGFEKGMKTIVMVNYSPELFTVLFALFKIGAVPVIVDPGMGLSRMMHCYQKVGAEAFIGIPIAHILRVLKPKAFVSIKKVVTVGIQFGWSGPTLKKIEHNNLGLPCKVAKAETDDLLMINFTTGSTGPAKGVEYTHRQVSAMLKVMQDTYAIHSKDVGLVTLPLFALIDLFLGCESILAPMDPTKPAKVDPENILSAIEKFSASHVFASPALIHRITPAALINKHRLTTLKHFACGGAPATVDILKGISAALPEQTRVETSYGATEALPISSIDLNEILTTTQGLTASGKGVCVGKLVTGLSCKIIKIDDEPIKNWSPQLELPPGQVGEIMLSGDSVSQRYHNDESANQLMKVKINDQLWHRTGDLGWLDSTGRLWFCGRKNHRVNTEKKQLFSVQCEHIFNQHKAVYRSALVAIEKNDNKSKHIVICVELHQGISNAAIVIQELCTLAKFHKITAEISTFLVHPSFPVDVRHNAKINRTELCDWAGLQLGIKTLGKAPKLIYAIPILGWLYLFIGIIWPFSNTILVTIWWIDIFLSVIVHSLQIPIALTKTKKYGISSLSSVVKTIIFGATYWKFIEPIDSSTLRSDG